MQVPPSWMRSLDSGHRGNHDAVSLELHERQISFESGRSRGSFLTCKLHGWYPPGGVAVRPKASTWHTVGAQPGHLCFTLTTEGPGLWLPGIINAHFFGAGPNRLRQGHLTQQPSLHIPIGCSVPQRTTGMLPTLLPLVNTSVTASWQEQCAKVNIC